MCCRVLPGLHKLKGGLGLHAGTLDFMLHLIISVCGHADCPWGTASLPRGTPESCPELSTWGHACRLSAETNNMPSGAGLRSHCRAGNTAHNMGAKHTPSEQCSCVEALLIKGSPAGKARHRAASWNSSRHLSKAAPPYSSRSALLGCASPCTPGHCTACTCAQHRQTLGLCSQAAAVSAPAAVLAGIRCLLQWPAELTRQQTLHRSMSPGYTCKAARM